MASFVFYYASFEQLNGSVENKSLPREVHLISQSAASTHSFPLSYFPIGQTHWSWQTWAQEISSGGGLARAAHVRWGLHGFQQLSNS